MSIIKIISFITFFSIPFANLLLSQGLIKPENNKCIAGKVNKYNYTPPKKLNIPINMEAIILYNNGVEYGSFTAPLIKSKLGYYFLFKVPDSATVLLLGIVNANKTEDDLNGLIIPRKEIVDNNKGNGFFIYPLNKNTKTNLPIALVKAELLQTNIIRKLWLSKPEANILLKCYTASYQIDQSLKKRDSYIDYLELAYEIKPKEIKQEIITKINALHQEIDNEQSLQAAIYLYDVLQMEKEKATLESLVISKFPKGDLAKEKHWRRFYKTDYYSTPPNEALILDSLHKYITQYNDTSLSTKDNFFQQILEFAFNQNDWVLFKKYRNFFFNKSLLSGLDDQYANKIIGTNLDSVVNEIEMAKWLSIQSLIQSEKDFKISKVTDNTYPNYVSYYASALKTYAKVLYKYAQYDSAFIYQQKACLLKEKSKVTDLEFFVIYSLKANSISYTKQLIENYLLNGVGSSILTIEYKKICSQLKLPEDSIEKIIQQNALKYRQENTAEIFKKYGKLNANHFVLENITGKKIDLSQFKNKIVILDFWASWCSPCIASFTEMQKLVTKYKNDTTVVFLFVDTWENKKLQDCKETAKNILNKNNYNFNVIFDVDGQLAKQYKLKSIPSKFVIDQKGNIVNMGNDMNITLEIEYCKSEKK